MRYIFMTRAAFIAAASVFWGASVAAEKAFALPHGEFRERAVLEWNDSNSVSTRVVRIWDRFPELQRTFEWTPKGERNQFTYEPGFSGQGRVEWRHPPVDVNAIGKLHEIYEGSFIDGHRDGEGRLTSSAGAKFEGQFLRGQFHGVGAIWLANGMQYVGHFNNGAPVGYGRLTFASGETFEGSLTPHQVDALNRGIDSAFYFGIEVEAPVAQLSSSKNLVNENLVPIQSADSAVEVRVYTDSARYIEFEDINAYPTYGYGHSVMTDKVVVSRNSLPDGSSRTEQIMLPAFLVGDFENIGNSAVEIERAYLAVRRSRPDLRPYPIVSSIFDHVICGWRDDLAFPSSKVNVDNYGLGQIRDAMMSLQLSNRSSSASSRELNINLGDFKDFQSVSIFGVLEELGVDLSALQKDDPNCPIDMSYSQCSKNVASTGIFGELTPELLIAGESRFISTIVNGHIEYSWKDIDGNIFLDSIPFREEVPIYSFADREMLECGAPGPITYTGRKIWLDAERSDYFALLDLPSDLRTLQPSQNIRVGIVVDSESSSIHEFRLVLELSDGTRASSLPVELNSYYLRTEKTYPSESYSEIFSVR